MYSMLKHCCGLKTGLRDKIVVLGNGYLGNAFKTCGVDVLDKNQFNIIKGETDNFAYMDEKLSKYAIIINCIAKSNTRFCEEHFEEALFSNAEVVMNLKNWCKIHRKKFVHISTGCLYDRNSTPQKETDFISAHCNYTLTKWIGEKYCNPDEDLILRPRLFFDYSTRPANLLIKLKNFERLCNEIDSITSIDTLVGATLELIYRNVSGIFNVANDGYISMHEIGQIMGLDKDIISIDEIRRSQGLYLVNNIMCIKKLKQYYRPRNIKQEVEYNLKYLL